MIYTIHPIRMIRKNSNFLPTIAGIALMTITACASANLGDFTKATQDAAIATAVASATAEATAAAQTAADTARAAQNTAVANARAEEKRIAQTAQGIAVAAARCTDPVCDNVVKADDLLSYPTAPPSSASAFLTITGTEIATTGVTTGIVGGQRNAPTIGGSTRAGDNMDGFRYFAGQFGGTGNTVFFAGILPTTNLGAPLTAQPTNAVWPGFIFNGAAPHAELDFNIDFANRRITAGYARQAASLSFNLGFSDSGVISGLVLEHDLALTTNVIGFAHATGLIGTEGLVGVYIDSAIDSTATDIYGGFVANNPDTNP